MPVAGAKLRQLAALVASRHLFAPDPDRELQIDEDIEDIRGLLAAHPRVDG
jgi:hypothetical protein